MIFVVLVFLSYLLTDSAATVEVERALKARLAFRKNALKVMDAKNSVVETTSTTSSEKKEKHNKLRNVHTHGGGTLHRQAPPPTVAIELQKKEKIPVIDIVDIIGDTAQVQVNEKVNQKINEKSTEKVNEKSTEKSTEKLAEKSTEKENEKLTEKSTEKLNAESTRVEIGGKVNEDVNEEVGDKLTDEEELKEQNAAESKVRGCSPAIPHICPNGKPFADLHLPHRANGCGPSLPNNPVLESLVGGVLNGKFTSCCNSHDDCYATFKANKDDCDYKFYQCMLTKCEGWFCKTRAYGYYLAVSEGGCSPFENAQKKHGCGVVF